MLLYYIMKGAKRLRSIAHDIAHHAISGLSYVHPHLGERRETEHFDQISVDLLIPRFSPVLKHLPREIELSTQALRDKFATFLVSKSVDRSEIESAVATFVYRGRSSWPYACRVQIKAASGQVIEDAVGQDGRRAEILHD